MARLESSADDPEAFIISWQKPPGSHLVTYLQCEVTRAAPEQHQEEISFRAHTHTERFLPSYVIIVCRAVRHWILNNVGGIIKNEIGKGCNDCLLICRQRRTSMCDVINMKLGFITFS